MADRVPLGVPVSGTYTVPGPVWVWPDDLGVRFDVDPSAPTGTGRPWSGRGPVPWRAAPGAALHIPGTAVVTLAPSPALLRLW